MLLKRLSIAFFFFIVLSFVPLFTVNAEETTRLTIPHKFTTYDKPDFNSTVSGKYNPQTVTVLDQQGSYWYLIRTNKGDKWVYYNPSLGNKTFDFRFNGFDGPGFDYAKVTSFAPATVKVTAVYNNWYQIETTNYHNVWVYDGTVRIPHRFAAYDSPDFLSNQVGTFASQAVRVVDRNKNWFQIVTTNYGNKWVYYNPDDPKTISFDYEYSAYSKPSFSTKQSSYHTTTLNVVAKYGDWYQVQTSKGLEWVYKQKLSIPHRFSAYDSASFTSKEVAQFSSQTVTVVEKKGSTWYKIRTSNYGEKWIYYNSSLGNKTFTNRFDGYKEPNFSNKVSSFSPTTVRITAQYGDWLQFQSGNFGNLWVYTGGSSNTWGLPLASTSYRVTSEHGWRTLNGVRDYHAGIDLAQSGTVSIIAAADGVVTKSYFDSSYGQVVFIKHTVNGQVYEAVYAHMKLGSQEVKAGDTVKKGETIGIMGSTGNSTGQHLHFEIHVGSYKWQVNDRNPRNYINF